MFQPEWPLRAAVAADLVAGVLGGLGVDADVAVEPAGSTTPADLRLRCPDGAVRVVLRDGEEAREHRIALVLDALGIHPYSGTVDAHGTYAETFDGPAGERLLGGDHAPGEDPAAAWERRIAPADASRYRDAMRRLSVGEEVTVDYRLVGYDGVTRWVRERARPQPGAPGEPVRVDGVVEDVSVHRLAEELARTAEAEHRVVARVARLVAEQVPLRDLAQRAVEAIAEGFGLPAVRLLRETATGERPYAAIGEAGDRPDADAVVTSGGQRWGRLEVRLPEGPLRPDLTPVAEMLGLAIHGVESRDRLARSASTDELTGIPNRRAFDPHLVAACDAAHAAGRPVALILLDVDHFKRINDVHGHVAGDEVLRRVATVLHAATRVGELAARVGGEEFAVVLPDTDEDAAVDAAERLRAAIAAIPSPVGRVAASAGVAVAGAETSASELYANADTALYAAKRSGRDRTRAFGRLDRADLLLLEPEPVRTAQVLLLAACASANEGMLPLHNERVGELAAETAHELGLDPGVVLRCRLGGLLHDVGKISIPIDLLRSQGPLTDRERATVRRHVEVGADLIARVPDLADVAPAVRHHLERWDGCGFPDGLAGRRIPIEARVVGAASLFVTLTEERAYARALAWEEAVAELRRSAGNALDPRVALAVIAVLHARRARIGRLLADSADGAA